MKVVVVLYLILHCALPLISGKTSSGGESLEVTKDERKFLSKSNSLRDSIPNADVKGSDRGDDLLENWKLDPSQAPPPKLFTAYKETYITKAAAKRFLQKIRSLKKPYTEKEYDDLLQEIMLEPKPTSKYSIYDKKYFDYLPSDQQDMKLDQGKSDQDTTKESHHQHRHHERRHQRRERAKRHTEKGEEKKLEKRHSDVEWTRHFLEHERMYHEQLRRDYEEQTNQRYQQPFQALYTNQIYTLPVSADPNNPWNNPFYRPRLNNYYLPPDPSQFIVRPQQTFISYPIPGVVYNPPHPPQNPPVTQVTKPPTTSPPDTVDSRPGISTGSRFGEDGPVWDVQDKPSRLIPETPTQSFTPTPTRRPAPPVIRDNEDYYDDLTALNRIPQGGGSQSSVNQGAANQGSVNQGVRTTTRRPPPPLIHNSPDYDDLPSNTGSAQRPPSSQPNFNQVALSN
ncbi:uncharacterized protein LOC132257654 isoform X2 [Phlebotomus argentipes]|uniref:uncharacterized protein LOC132257654 isoform X2 n=1 Tax=Phlebotomus argentipes TaxID=94469 RepID=UPI00289350D9|nr:uncharacterized protein LOC132257654 isoform X2 [Phlebotomus argentipes]